MPRIHKRFYYSVVLDSAIFCGFGLPATAASYHVDGGIAEIFNGRFNRLQSYSLDLGVQAGGGVNYDSPGVHAQADSIAEDFGVRLAHVLRAQPTSSRWTL